MPEFQSMDGVSGKAGRAYAKINGNNEEMFYASKIEAKLEKSKGEIKSIGRTMTGNKASGLKGSGSMTLYYVSPLFRTMMATYANTGRDTYFDLVIENDDPGSDAGKQTLLLLGVNLNSVILGKLDGSSEGALEEDVDFTFESFKYLNSFTKI